MVTAYDAPSGRLADAAGIDVILVGDSAAMTVLGHDSTVPATMDEMIVLTRAVTRGARRPLVVADMPFGSFQVSDEEALRNAIRFVKEAGADAVKLEGAGPMLSRVRALVGGGHPGDGPHRPDAAVGDDARRLQGAGPDGARRRASSYRTRWRSRRPAASRSCSRPCPHRWPRGSRTRSRCRRSASARASSCDGQVLVWHDLLGLYEGRAPRFVKRYAELATEITRALGATSTTCASAASRRSSTRTRCPRRSSRCSRRSYTTSGTYANAARKSATRPRRRASAASSSRGQCARRSSSEGGRPEREADREPAEDRGRRAVVGAAVPEDVRAVERELAAARADAATARAARARSRARAGRAGTCRRCPSRARRGRARRRSRSTRRRR